MTFIARLADTLVFYIALFSLFSPLFLWLFAFVTHSLLHSKISRLKQKSTPNQFQDYVDKYNWKYSVEFFYPTLMIDKYGLKRKKSIPTYFTQVSKSDVDVFENWLLNHYASVLEFKTTLGSLVKVKPEEISKLRIRIEAIPKKIKTSKCLYALVEEDGTQTYAFEKKPDKEYSKFNKIWLIILICFITIKMSRLIIFSSLLNYFIWNSYNMTYLFKNYPLGMIRKLPKKENADFFKK